MKSEFLFDALRGLYPGTHGWAEMTNGADVGHALLWAWGFGLGTGFVLGWGIGRVVLQIQQLKEPR